ncbi:MAG: MarR family transcriptional regulator [Smithella sp.]
MIVSWMGRYREVVAAFVRHGNTVARFLNTKSEIYPGIFLSHQEWQVLEYIIEHESDDSIMSRISEQLAIPQSSFSKIIKLLYNYHLVAKYRMKGNHKNIILKATDIGIKVYESYSEVIRNGSFLKLFETLSVLSDEDLSIVAKAINELDDGIGADCSKPCTLELIPFED